jgi:hypothetical protein
MNRVGLGSEATDQVQPPPPIHALASQGISSGEIQPSLRQPPNATTVYGESALELFRATEKLEVQKVRDLLGAGASIDSMDPQGRTLIDIAVTLGRIHRRQDEMVRMLLEKGAKFTCTDPAAVKLFKEINVTIIESKRQKRTKRK